MSPLKCVIACESMTGSIWTMNFSHQYLYGVTNIVSYFGWFISCKSCPMEGLLGVVFSVGRTYPSPCHLYWKIVPSDLNTHVF